MVAGLWGNGNYDDDKGTRKNALTKLDEQMEDAIGSIYGQSVEVEIDKDDPFFAAIDLPDIDQKELEESKRVERPALIVPIEVDQE